MKLSVGIITYNEDRIIAKTLKAVTDIADEIVIVDSYSQDNTVDIAKSFGAKVYTEKWKGFGPQKNSVIDKCTGDWILLIDADEVISHELAEKIKLIINRQNQYSVYKINRCCVCFGKLLKHGGWSNQYAVRLWRRGLVTLDDKPVHEGFITDGKAEKIKEIIYHHTYLTIQDYINRVSKYSSLGAGMYYAKRKKTGKVKIILGPLFAFINMYFFRLGFLDGLEGFVIAYATSFANMVKYFKLREIYRSDVNIKEIEK